MHFLPYHYCVWWHCGVCYAVFGVETCGCSSDEFRCVIAIKSFWGPMIVKIVFSTSGVWLLCCSPTRMLYTIPPLSIMDPWSFVLAACSAIRPYLCPSIDACFIGPVESMCIVPWHSTPCWVLYFLCYGFWCGFLSAESIARYECIWRIWQS